tara:strand:+ start:79 stop:681 length:603 start_codon:yes stop_codon:yes gene_type:complete
MATLNFKIIKNFFNKNELLLLQKYCFKKIEENNNTIDEYSFSPSWYEDILMTSILETKLELVEEASDKKLLPTYAYWRYYVFGGDLKKHTDRPACEISVTACIKKFNDWPLTIENSTIELNQGDALLYAGCVHSHSRPGVYKGEGMAQAFFHYVEKDGVFAHHAYDNFSKIHKKNYAEGDEKIKKNLINNYRKNNERKNS